MKYILLLILLMLIIVYIFNNKRNDDRENFLDEKDINSNVRYTNYLLRGFVENKISMFPQ